MVNMNLRFIPFSKLKFSNILYVDLLQLEQLLFLGGYSFVFYKYNMNIIPGNLQDLPRMFFWF